MKVQKMRVILKSRSNKKLVQLTNDFKITAQRCACVVRGPVCFKGKRLLDIYMRNGHVIDMLMIVPACKKVDVTFRMEG